MNGFAPPLSTTHHHSHNGQSMSKSPTAFTTPATNNNNNRPSVITRTLSRHQQSPISPSTKSKIQSIPKVPSWFNDRVYMTNSYLSQKTYDTIAAHSPSHSKTHLFPARVQEMILIEELLSAMCGMEGKYILIMNKNTPNTSSNSFSLPTRQDSFNGFLSAETEQQSEEFYLKPGAWEPSLSYLIQRIIPICNKYIAISNFVQSRDCSYEYGLVSQAFVAAVKVLIREYLTFVAQLESLFQKQTLALQKIWLHIQQPLRTLSTLETLTREIRSSKAKGGALLSIIHRLSLSMAGDTDTQKLFQFLMERSCVPYFKMVNDWVYNGQLDDLYSEFMICANLREEDSYDPAATYWEKRFTIRPEQVPIFLNESIATKILQSGKYLNVMSYSETQIINSTKVDSNHHIEFTSHKREYVTKIDSAYSVASERLVKYIMEEHKLMELMHTLRDVFLFKRGDFYVHFMDNSEIELQKKATHIIPSKIQSLLELSMRTSTVNEATEISAELSFAPISALLDVERFQSIGGINALQARDTYSLSGIEALSIKPLVKFPLSLVINQTNVNKYQLLFRHLFQCKCVERSLLKAWLEHKFCREYSLGNSVAPLYALRMKMLHFTRELLFFSFNEIEKSFLTMEKKLKKAGTLDEIMTHHQEFLDHSMSVCMLTLQKPYRALSKVLSTCKVFSDYMIHFTKGLTLVDDSELLSNNRTSSPADVFERRRTQIAVISQHARQTAQSEYHLNSIAQFNKNFDDSFQLLLDALRTSGSDTTLISTHFAQLFNKNSNGF
jgi:gamma-tubulin complex component 2